MKRMTYDEAKEICFPFLSGNAEIKLTVAEATEMLLWFYNSHIDADETHDEPSLTEQSAFLDTQIGEWVRDNFNLNCLPLNTILNVRNGIDTFRDVYNMGRVNFMKCKGVGAVALTRFADLFDSYGLDWKNDPISIK